MYNQNPQQPIVPPASNPAPPIEPTQTTQSAPAVELKPPKPFFLNKLFFLLLVLIILFAGGGTYFFLNSQNKPAPAVSKIEPTSSPTPTPNPTKTWRVYTNITYGYSIKYPNDWHIVEEESKNPENIVFSETTKGDVIIAKPALVSVAVIDKKDFNENWINNFSPFSYKTFERQDKIFALIADTYQEGAAASRETEKLAIETLNKMIPTLRFTDSIPADTSSWKVYKNSTHGYSFKYPPGFLLLKEAAEEVTLGANNIEHIKITYSNFENYKSYPKCVVSKDKKLFYERFPCVTSSENINVENKEAERVYVYYGLDEDFYIVKILNPEIQLKMYIVGGGISQTFEEILHTFRFTQ